MVPPPPPPPQPTSSRMEEGVRFGESDKNVRMSPFVVWVNVATTVTQFLLGSVAFLALLVANPFWDFIPKFSAHVYFVVIGYMILMSQVLLSYNLNTGFTNNLRFPKKRTLHWFLQVIGSTIALIGCCLGLATNADSDIDHLETTHGIVGFIAMLMTAVSLVGGLMHIIKWKQMSTMIYETSYAIVFTLTLIFAYTAFCIQMAELTDGANQVMIIFFTVIALLLTLIMTFIDLLVRTGYFM
uniref:ascorbate ferrireductase (transmembrane) n=1 Tax=Heliothis virescens TaxID=7102 RepID=A0A2A4K6S9_HELVI